MRGAASTIDRLGGARIVVVSWLGEAEGSHPLAAAIACAGSRTESAGLLVEVGEERRPRPALFATASARALEERIAAHLPGAAVASRGSICQLALPAGDEGVRAAASSLPLVRDSVAVLHVPPAAFEPALDSFAAEAVLVRADVREDRALVALAVRSLLERGLRVVVAKRALPWVVSRRALFGALPGAAG